MTMELIASGYKASSARQTELNTECEQTVEHTDMETTAVMFTVQHFSDSNVTFLYCEKVAVSPIERRAVPTVERRTAAGQPR